MTVKALADQAPLLLNKITKQVFYQGGAHWPCGSMLLALGAKGH